MTATNRSDDRSTLTAARPVTLVRYRPGISGETMRTVHVMPLASSNHETVARALCGAPLRTSDIEVVAPGQGMPCERCLITQAAASTPLAESDTPSIHSDAGLDEAAAYYLEWGWPLTTRGDQIWLRMEPETVALIIPTPIATDVVRILIARRCRPAVLTHPYAPEHEVLLAGEPYPTPLPWPPATGRITTTVPLPPSRTLRGRLRWVCPPHQDSLRLCREIDIAAAIRLHDSHPSLPTASRAGPAPHAPASPR